MKYKLDICIPSGFGHYEIGITYRGKIITTITNDISSIDDYKSERHQRDGRQLRIKRGYNNLRNEIIRKNK